MKLLSINTLFFIFFSLFTAFILGFFFQTIAGIQLPFVEMTIFFWVLYLPQQFHLINVWFCGLLLDTLMHTPLGEHALTLIIAAYLIRKFYQRLQMFPFWQQSCAISFILLFHQALLFWLQQLMNQPQVLSMLWISPLFCFLCWPILASLLKQKLIQLTRIKINLF